MPEAINQQRPPGLFDDLSAWFFSVPVVTRGIFFGSLFTSLACKLGFISPYALILSWPAIYKNFEIWRLITSFLFIPTNFGGLMLMYFLYNYSKSLEQEKFAQRKADYVFFVIFCATGLLILGVLLKQMILLEALTIAMLYVWAMDHRDQTVTFYFGVQFQAKFLPYVLIGFDFLTGEQFPPVGKLMGIAVGHLYYFLDEIYPSQNNGARILHTPQFIVNMLSGDAPDITRTFGARGTRLGGTPGGIPPRAAGTQQQPERPIPRANDGGARAAGDSEMRYRWGSGQRLGE